MPIYEYRCADCGAVAEVLQSGFQEKTELVCEECGNSDMKKVMSSFSTGKDSAGGAGSCPTGTCPL